MRLIMIASVFAATVVAGSSANAEILAHNNNVNSQTFAGGADFSVGLNGNDKKTLKFKTNKKKTVLIQFFAECAVDGTPNDYVDIDIMVDSAGPGGFQAIAPTQDDNAMCAGSKVAADGSLDRWVGAVVAGVIEVPKGTHKVKINGILYGGGSVRLDDTLVTVQD